jgi:hypothetical protein
MSACSENQAINERRTWTGSVTRHSNHSLRIAKTLLYAAGGLFSPLACFCGGYPSPSPSRRPPHSLLLGLSSTNTYRAACHRHRQQLSYLTVGAAAASDRIQGTSCAVVLLVVAASGVYPRLNSMKRGEAMTTVAPAPTTADRILAYSLVTWRVSSVGGYGGIFQAVL